jgi:hypothetical protein
MVPAIAFAYFLAFEEEREWWRRIRSSVLRSLPSGVLAVAFYLLRSALFADTRITFELGNLIRIPALVVVRTFYPQEILGRIREDSPLSSLIVAGLIGLAVGAILLRLVLRSRNRPAHLFGLFSAAAYILLFSIAGTMNAWYVYTVVPFAGISICLLLDEGISEFRAEGNRLRAALSVLVCLMLLALIAVPSPLFVQYKAWPIAGDLGENFLNALRRVTDSTPTDVAVVAINTPCLYGESRSEFVETRHATIFYPKTVQAWAKLNGIKHEIVIFGVSRAVGEFTTPKIDLTREGVARISFDSDRADYLSANDPHVRALGEIDRGCELAWPPQDLVSKRFEVYVFNGKELVPLAADDRT